ncbi:putative Iron (Metal) dependent repressor, DtxR family [Candidatus Zixiibacteriota bacterium]|nr:putative Iron (Metal) dependent repressor, DtxR family [candidate division Zixibacteria bacterium]
MLEYSNIILTMKLTTKEEDYLETIYLLSRDSEKVALTDIARERGVTLPTVFSALSRLKKNGMVTQPHYGKIALSSAGEKLGSEIFDTHRVIRQFLDEVLQLPADVAEATACRMEHGITIEAVRRLEMLIKIMRNCDGKNAGCLMEYKEQLHR